MKTENYQPVFAVAFGHLAYSPHILPEQQFNVRLVVLCRQCKETVQHILAKGDQFLGQKAQISNWLHIKSRMVCLHCANVFDFLQHCNVPDVSFHTSLLYRVSSCSWVTQDLVEDAEH